jgi:1-acyl-sn-glycerol-3-phosphate acyltransferase
MPKRHKPVVRSTMRAVGWFLLNAAQAIFLSFWSAFWISTAVLVSIFSRELPLVLARRCWGPGLIWASLAKVTVEFEQPLDQKLPYVFVMNHQSMYDIAVAFAKIPRNLRFVAKRILAYVPFIGLFLWRMGMVMVDRKDPKSAYEKLKAAADKLRGGDCFLAYPEGTRSSDGKILSFKRGSFLTAIQAGAAIVPVAIDGSGKVLPRGGFKLRPGPIRVAIGAPIPTTGMSEDDTELLVEKARDAMIALHVGIGGLGGDKKPLPPGRAPKSPAARNRGSSSRGADISPAP